MQQAGKYNRGLRAGSGAPGPAPPGFAEVATFFGICVWLVPLFLFLSLSANDNALPTSVDGASLLFCLICARDTQLLLLRSVTFTDNTRKRIENLAIQKTHGLRPLAPQAERPTRGDPRLPHTDALGALQPASVPIRLRHERLLA